MVASAPQSSAEEEAVKRDTDCVYFLASPLTCKKGSECEYRHSHIARLNPRDCWFWLHGNCLNAKCSFRHPPLDGLLGTKVPTPTGSSVPVTRILTESTTHVQNGSTKLGVGVACIFFQKGNCLRGGRCPFLHEPTSLSSKAHSVSGTAPASTIKKVSSGLDKTMPEKILPANVDKSFGNLPQPKRKIELESSPSPLGDEFSVKRRVQLQQASGATELPGYKSVPYVSTGFQESWSNHVQPHMRLDEPESMNKKEAEGVSRELSPGFDVLVDDNRRDSDYYLDEDRYGMSMEHEARNEFVIGHSTEYDTSAPVDDDAYLNSLGYDPLNYREGIQYAWEEQRALSGRISRGSYLERRPHGRRVSLVQVDKLDLRHHLENQEKPNGLRSVINHEYVSDVQIGDRCYNEQYGSLLENSLSVDRLQGRIRRPRRFSSPSSRLSPVRTSISSHHGRIREKIKGRWEEASNNGGKNNRDFRLRRNATGDNNTTDFAGPKSLAELKNQKNAEPIQHHITNKQSLGKRKHLGTDGNQQTGNDLSFEGPKPLGEILKRKRGGIIGTINGRASSGNQGIIEDENHHGRGATENEAHKFSLPQKTEVEVTGLSTSNSALESAVIKLEMGDSVVPVDGADREPEAYHLRSGQSDHEQIDGHNSENGDGDGDGAGEEYVDDEDDDDFAKKMGVVHPEV